METKLLFIVAILSVVQIIMFFVERSALVREFTLAMEEEDKSQSAILLMKRQALEAKAGSMSLAIPFIILTIIDVIPQWVVWTGWYAVIVAIIRLFIVHFSRGRDTEKQKAFLKKITPFMVFIMPLFFVIISVYSFTIFAVYKTL